MDYFHHLHSCCVSCCCHHRWAVSIPPGEVFHVLAHHLFGAGLDGVAEPTRVIVRQVRLPRVVLGVVAGAGLAVAGVALTAPFDCRAY